VAGPYGGWDVVDITGQVVRVPAVCSADGADYGYFSDTENRVINDCVHCKIVDGNGEAASFLKFERDGRIYAPSGETNLIPKDNYSCFRIRWYHEPVRIHVNNSEKEIYLYRRVSVAYMFSYIWAQVRMPNGRYKWTARLSTNSNVKPCIGVTEEIYIPNLDKPGRFVRVESAYRLYADYSTKLFTITSSGQRTQSFAPLGADALPWDVLFSTKEEFISHTEPVMRSYASNWDNLFQGDITGISVRGSSGTTAVVCDTTIEPDSPTSIFMFNEPDLIVGKIPYIGKTGYWFNWLIQHAYLEACQSVPTLNDNSISNLIEIVGFIKSLVVDHKIEFPKRLQDVWLQYRYVYKTSELDIKEAIKFAKRYMSLGTLDRKLKLYGQSETTVFDSIVKCRCTLEIKPNEMGYVSKIWNALQTYGLTPDFYVIWDMIPYSFIVDWFIPVGDMLGVLDASSVFRPGERYDISNVCFSLAYQRPFGSYTYKCYSRWAAEPLQTFNEFYWLDKPAASDKVRTFRVLDAISLAID
jgi:hypothetical protein